MQVPSSIVRQIKRSPGIALSVALGTLLLMTWLWCSAAAKQPASGRDEVVDQEDVETAEHDRALYAPKLHDMQKISVLTANRFHELVLRCLGDLPNGLSLKNGGPIGTYQVPGGQRIGGEEPPHCLNWQVNDDNFCVFSFDVSLSKTKATVVELEVDGVRLYVNAGYVKGLNLDAKLTELGNLSAREVLARLGNRPSP